MSVSPNSQNYNICPLNLTVKSDNTDSTSTSSKNDSTSTTSNDRSKCVRYDHTPDLTESSESSEKVEKNIIFRNTEAARDFLTRQFSWMSSAGEEYLAECTEKPTRIIKENVTNMASFVYEGVKTVGDKVVTLSRHVSGSSDNCDVLEMAEDVSLPRITSKDEFMWSLSQGTSERDLSEHGIQERCNIVTRNGSNLLNCEVWTWGNVTHGQLGIGDSIKRERPMIITKLSNVGARKVSVQGSHAAALTLDGRAYLWGRNDYNQVTVDSTVDQSSPRLFIINSEERVRDIACGLYQTFLMSSKLNLIYIGKRDVLENEKVAKLYTCDSGNDDKLHLSMINNKRKLKNNILVTSQFAVMNTAACDNEFILDFTISEQQYFDEMLLVHSNLIKTMLKKNIISSDSSVYEQLMESFSELLYFTAANIQSLLDFINGLVSEMDITMFKYIEEHLHLYKKYLIAINDIISLGAFTHISKTIDISSSLNKMKSRKDKTNPEQVVYSALTLPLQRLNSYPSLIRNILPFLIKKDQRLQEILTKWTTLIEEQQQKQAEAEKTKEFWLNSGKTIEQFRTPNRRLIRESHKHPVQLQNAGRFSSHWFILLTDILVHVNGSTPHIHDLTVVWVEPPNDDTYSQNQICLRMPEEVIVLCTVESEQKAEWLQALQNAIKMVLNKTNGIQPPTVRSAEYSFYKTGFYKDAKYKGRWSNGKMHGSGKLEWSDGRIYTGQFSNNQIHGFGRMEIPNVGVYEGLWKDNQQNGFGILKYSNGDIYKGYFKDGVPHGHGSLKHGNFMASTASIYIGDWVLGNKNGYGVMDDIVTGEKYLGSWSDNKKHGTGLIVTSDGIYYEGTFNQDVLTGHGLMILEDGTHYEGDFKGTGNLSGKGTLTLNSGHTIEGNLSGSLIDGIKISSGILNLTKNNNNVDHCVRPSSFGKLCTPVGQKWKALFRQCYQMLGVPENNPKTNLKVPDTQKIWQNIAVLISNSHQGSLKKKKTERSLENSINNLDTIPKFGRNKIDADSYLEIKQYLSKAFDSSHHPLGSLLADLNVAYTTTYGGLRAHPLLLTHAVAELHSITRRLYDIIKLLFPALPSYEKEIPLEHGDESEVISYQNLLYPIILPKIHLPLFILYTLHNKPQDVQYWKRLIEWNKHSDFTLMAFLSVDQKFLGNQGQDQGTFLPSPVKDQTFLEAIETLQLLKTTFSPLEKLLIIRQTFEKMTEVVQVQLGHDYKWSMDDLFPAFLYVVVRARILQLGSELHFIEDFMQPSLENGELGIMFTTLKACYQQILQEKTSIN
ncbi:hypothetical protein ILUMI_23775 [Ignelater luminosus]|uniref:Alsin n=1 Tax=Ignelater luminosus TaxID=2038154 RepID=A0A8K0FWT1_IGNLU|nr:hypothetical protein ILUMI_23775 [Ignelater luminosus]